MRWKGLKIAAVCLGLLLLGFLLALPTAVTYLRSGSNLCHDVGLHLGDIRSGARVYYLGPRWDKSGEVLPPSFPTGVKQTPAQPRCGDAAVVPRDAWTAAGWDALRFPATRLPQAHCSYDFSSLGVGTAASYRARVVCQYACDEVPRVLEATGWVDDEGNVRAHNRWFNCRWRGVERTARKLLSKVTFGRVDYPDVLEFGERPRGRK